MSLETMIEELKAERDEKHQKYVSAIETLQALAESQTKSFPNLIDAVTKRRGRPSTKAAPAKSGERKGTAWTAKRKAEHAEKIRAAHAKRKRADKQAAKQRGEPEVVLRPDPSPLGELYKTKEFQEDYKKALAEDMANLEKPKRGRPKGVKNKQKASVLPEQMPSPVFEGDELDQRSHEEVTA